jgi:hypothetical protein
MSINAFISFIIKLLYYKFSDGNYYKHILTIRQLYLDGLFGIIFADIKNIYNFTE